MDFFLTTTKLGLRVFTRIVIALTGKEPAPHERVFFVRPSVFLLVAKDSGLILDVLSEDELLYRYPDKNIVPFGAYTPPKTRSSKNDHQSLDLESIVIVQLSRGDLPSNLTFSSQDLTLLLKDKASYVSAGKERKEINLAPGQTG